MRTLPLWLAAFGALGCGGSTSDGSDATGGDAGSAGAAAGGGSGGSGGTAGKAGGLGIGGSAGSAAGAQGGAAGASGNGGCGTTLTGRIRDMKKTHPDFEYKIGDDKGIVKTDLGADGKPVYASATSTPTTHGKVEFDQWYRDAPGVNIGSALSIALVKGTGGVYTYSNQEFFPIDGAGFGNEGNPHNFHFTFELHTKFKYAGGETFRFTGDDDLFTFVNGKLAIDLGGVHGAEDGIIDLDSNAKALGLVKGQSYSLDFFFAERHTSQSTFRIDTSLDFVDCGVGEPK